jgi:hypothetical protein
MRDKQQRAQGIFFIEIFRPGGYYRAIIDPAA